MSYPFRYYGRAPGDWHSGANEGHVYEIQFRAPPPPEAREQLAQTYETMLATGPARLSMDPWDWSGRFARFAVGERWSGATRATFSRVTDFLLAAHRVCAIADVAFWGMREAGVSRWDHWTVAKQAGPDPGPQYDPPGGVRQVDSTLAIAAPDEGFEAARLRARSDVQQRRIAKANAGSDVKLVSLGRKVEYPKLSDTLNQIFGTPEPAQVQRGGYNSEADGYHPMFETPRPIARHMTDGYADGFAFLDEAGEVKDVVFPDGKRAGHSLAMHRDGDRGLCASRNHLYEIDFSTGVATPRFVLEDRLEGLDFLGDLWVVRGEKALLVLDPSTPVPTVVATAKGKGTWVSVLREDSVIVTGQYSSKLRVFAYAEGKLRKVAGFETKLASPIEVDGQVLLYANDAAAHYVLDGLDEAVEAWAAPLREKAEKARRRPKKVGAPVLRSCAAVEPVPPAPAEVDFGEYAHAVGRFALLPRTAPEAATAIVKRHDIAYVDDAGTVVRLGRDALKAIGQSLPLSKLVVTPDGGSAATTSHQDVVVVSAAGELSRWQDRTWGVRQILHPTSDLVVLLCKEIRIGRRGPLGWHTIAVKKVAGANAIRIHGRLLAVGADAAKSLHVFAISDDGLIPLVSFSERLRRPCFVNGRLYVSTPEGDTFEVVGVRELLDKKLATANRKRKNAAKKKGPGTADPRPLEAVPIDISGLPEPTWPPESAYGWVEDNGYSDSLKGYGLVSTATLSRDGRLAWLCDGTALIELDRKTSKSTVVCDAIAGKPIAHVGEVDSDYLVCATANKLVTLRREGPAFVVEQMVGATKIVAIDGIPDRNAAAVTTGDDIHLYTLSPTKKPKKVGTIGSRAHHLRGQGDRLYVATYRTDQAWEIVGLDGVLPK